MKCPRLKAVGLLPVVELPHLTQEALMKEYYIGLDVHKDSVFIAVLDDRKVRSDGKADSGVIEMREPRNPFCPGPVRRDLYRRDLYRRQGRQYLGRHCFVQG
jgi:hypothetical protein